MSYGYLYTISNESMPGILKVGMTERTPDIRLNEANGSDTWRPPTPYKLEFAKKVSDPKQKEKTIHILLSQYTERINPKREFFRVSVEEVKTLFDLVDGDLWIEKSVEEIEDEEEDDEDLTKTPVVKGSRNMTKCFINGQLIRHKIGINKIWIGIYDSVRNGITFDNVFYKSLSGFAERHHNIYKTPDEVKRTANGWLECEYEVNGTWVSTYNIQ